jgi:hypothetical protein
MQFVLPLLIAVVLGVFALAFVLYPFYRRAPTNSAQQSEIALFPWIGNEGEGGKGGGGGRELVNGHRKEQAAPLSESEHAARSALHEIELDYQLGNISESDYRTLRERYLQRALVALKSRYDREQALDDEIETQLQKMKEDDDSVEK